MRPFDPRQEAKTTEVCWHLYAAWRDINTAGDACVYSPERKQIIQAGGQGSVLYLPMGRKKFQNDVSIYRLRIKFCGHSITYRA